DRSGNQDHLCAGLGGDLEDEHDGAEPDVDGEPSIGYDVEPPEQDTGNDEPSLGWTDEEAARGRTYAGSHGTSADCEEGEPARQPQNRTSIDREPITVEVSYRRFLRGLAPEQRKRVKAARRRDVGNDVIIACPRCPSAPQPAGPPAGFCLPNCLFAALLQRLFFPRRAKRGDRYCEVVQCDEGLWFHRAGWRRWQGRVCPHFGR